MMALSEIARMNWWNLSHLKTYCFVLIICAHKRSKIVSSNQQWCNRFRFFHIEFLSADEQNSQKGFTTVHWNWKLRQLTQSENSIDPILRSEYSWNWLETVYRASASAFGFWQWPIGMNTIAMLNYFLHGIFSAHVPCCKRLNPIRLLWGIYSAIWSQFRCHIVGHSAVPNPRALSTAMHGRRHLFCGLQQISSL